MLSLPCLPEGDGSVGAVLDPDLDGNHGTDWGIFRFDPNINDYALMQLTDVLLPGEGYWLKSLLSGQSITVGGAPNTTTPFILPLLGQPGGQFNLLGYPALSPLPWPDALVRFSDGTPPDPQDVPITTPGVPVSTVLYKWVGGGYQAYQADSPIPLLQGELQPWDGYWVQAVQDPLGLDPSIVLPLASTRRIGQGRDAVVSTREEWWLQLWLSAGDLESPRATLGQLRTSLSGMDSGDLPELEAPSFLGENLLSVSFPHPDWERPGLYQTDFRPAGSSQSEEWLLELRTGASQRQVSLQWEGPSWVLARTTVLDLDTNEHLKIEPGGKLNLPPGKGVRRLLWKVAELPEPARVPVGEGLSYGLALFALLLLLHRRRIRHQECLRED